MAASNQPSPDILHFRGVFIFKKYGLPLLVGSALLMATGCGNSRKLGKTHSRQNHGKPQFEHDLLGKNPAQWEAKDPVVLSENHSVALRSFIDDWRGTPHRMGGNTKKGVDCSGFVIQAYLQVYQMPFTGRRAEDLFGETKPLKRDELEEGDLVFFKISGRRIDHVGIYLSRGDFVHVSSSRGVMVSNLSQAYFDKRFFRGGRPQ